jgi:pectate lyase
LESLEAVGSFPDPNIELSKSNRNFSLRKALTGVGLTINGQKNVIVRNLKISKVLADYGDCITIQKSTNVWVDHVDLSGDRDVDKDQYDGLVDLSHAADYVTISYTYFHDHVSVLPFRYTRDVITI